MDAHSCPLKFGSCKYKGKSMCKSLMSPVVNISVGSCNFFHIIGCLIIDQYDTQVKDMVNALKELIGMSYDSLKYFHPSFFSPKHDFFYY